MLTQLIPALIMFLFTLAATTLFFVPITVFPQKNELINFYWAGFWVFLAMIAALAGGSNVLMLLRYDALLFSNAILLSATVCFVIFVMFGWVRLSGMALLTLAKRITA